MGSRHRQPMASSIPASKAPSTRLLHAHTSIAALGLLHRPALPTMYKSAVIGLWPMYSTLGSSVWASNSIIALSQSPPLVLCELRRIISWRRRRASCRPSLLRGVCILILTASLVGRHLAQIHLPAKIPSVRHTAPIGAQGGASHNSSE